MKYIDAEKLIAEIERRIAILKGGRGDYAKGSVDADMGILEYIESLQQEQPEGIGGVVHHLHNNHWIITDQKQLATTLKEFPKGAEVELFIFARKEE